MRKGLKIMSAGLAVAIAISFGSAAAYASNLENGSAGALLDTDYTLEEMLIYAIQDEYGAQAEYAAIIKEYGDQVPYTNIIKAEENHINRLTQLFDTYGFALPANTAETVIPESLEASYAVGVTAEENNIAMYEKFLKEDLSADVKLVFKRLLTASEHHLQAFQNAVDGNLTNCLGSGMMKRSQGSNQTGCGGRGDGVGSRGNRGGGMGDNGSNCILSK